MNIPTDFLTPTDFEEFSNRISEVLFNKEIIGFGEGKDNGIDGIDNIVTPSIVIQSKRYQSRTTPASFVKIAIKEIDKIRETSLKFEWEKKFEYVIVTSVKLNPISRKKIRAHAKELMSSDINIIDGGVLKDLSSNEKYEKIFIDFDLKKENLIELLKYHKQECISLESREYFSDFNEKYFVETEVLYKLYDLLNNEHIAILTGGPGVGKTTMCKMIGSLFSAKCDGDYIILERNIDEIQKLIDFYNENFRQENSKKLFVVFDDFLGRTALETSERQIKKLRSLYSLVNNSENLFVLLNSRTQILSAAKNEDIEFGQLIDDKDNKKVTIDLSKYSSIEKARIFRKNIEFQFDSQSKAEKKIMDIKYCELINGKKYRSIVNHRNFNPRLIELIASQSLKSEGNYFDYCIKALDDPSKLYTRLFTKLPETHQLFLICLYCFDEYPVILLDMEASYKEILADDTYDLMQIEQDLEDSWIVVKNDSSLKNERVEFINPSIIDFISNKKNKNSFFEKITKNTRFLSQLVRADDTVKLYKMIRKNYDWFYVKDRFAGEKLSCLLEQEEIVDGKNFIELLYQFKGKYHRKPIENSSLSILPLIYVYEDWSDLVRELYFSKNRDAKNIFLQELLYSKINNRLVENMLDTTADLDSLAEYLEYLIEEIYDSKFEQNELIDFAEEASGLNLYSAFFYCKERRLQEVIDDYYQVDDLLDFNNLSDCEEDKKLEVRAVLKKHEENIYHELSSTFFEDKTEDFNFDFSGVEEYIIEQIEEHLQFPIYDDKEIETFHLNDVETVDSILGISLM